MEYKVALQEFEGPMDLLLHLIKKAEIDIFDINLCEITDQYLQYLNQMETLELDVASEYLALAAELMEIKSYMLLPRHEEEVEEEDPRERLLGRIIEYQQYKEVTETFKNLELERKEYFTKEISDLREYKEKEEVSFDFSLEELTKAFEEFLKRAEETKPLNTKIARREYSVSKRNEEIRYLLKQKKKMNLTELLDDFSKDYIVVTFLSILDLTRKQEIKLEQDENFSSINLLWREN